jgi:hypothetical protein
MSPEIFVKISKGLADTTHFALEHVKDKLPSELYKELLPMVENVSQQLYEVSSQPEMMKDKIESLEENVSKVWEKITAYFSENDSKQVTKELINNTHLHLTPDIVAHINVFNSAIQAEQPNNSKEDSVSKTEQPNQGIFQEAGDLLKDLLEVVGNFLERF